MSKVQNLEAKTSNIGTTSVGLGSIFAANRFASSRVFAPKNDRMREAYAPNLGSFLMVSSKYSRCSDSFKLWNGFELIASQYTAPNRDKPRSSSLTS